jgi:hypothetical protein
VSPDPVAYHFREFERIKASPNTYQPSLADRIKGIQDNQSKWDFHLQKLVELGAVQHERFVFTEVPYTRDASRRIWRSAYSNFPNAVMFSASYHNTNAAGYGAETYVLEVWDLPEEIGRWSAFVETHNRRD